MAKAARFSRRQRDRQDDQVPLPAGPISNGEFESAAGYRRDRAVNDSAPRLRVDRRRFLQGAGAVAASLAAFELAGLGGHLYRRLEATRPQSHQKGTSP